MVRGVHLWPNPQSSSPVALTLTLTRARVLIPTIILHHPHPRPHVHPHPQGMGLERVPADRSRSGNSGHLQLRHPGGTVCMYPRQRAPTQPA